jgi:hypothetical protein
MADENIQITNVQNSDGSKKHYSSLDGMRYINTNIGAGVGGVDISLGASGLLLQVGTNNPLTQQNTIIYDNQFTNSTGDPLAPTTTYTSDLETIAKLDSLIPAVQIAPSTTTLQIENYINIVNTSINGNTLTIDANAQSIGFNNTAVAPYITCNGSNQFALEGNAAPIIVNSGASTTQIGDIAGAGNSTKATINDSHNLIDLQCINLTANSDTYTYPICFSSKNSGNVNYGSPSSWQEVFHYAIIFPSFAFNTNSTYTDWKIDFALNCRNMTDQSNKELAMYFELEDQTTTIYTPFLFNNNTPYTTYKNSSTYSATSTQSENYCWSDYISLNGVNGNVPLEFHMYWWANSANTFDFELLVSFTRTNLV